MVLPPLTTPTHFTGRRSRPPVKVQAAPTSPIAAGSPRARLQAWRARPFGEDATPSPGAIRRSIFSLDPEELEAMILEAPAHQSGKGDEPAAPQELPPALEHLWAQEVRTNGSPPIENRYLVVDDLETGGKVKWTATATVAQEDEEGIRQTGIRQTGIGNRHRIRRLVAVGIAAGAGLLSLLLLCTAPRKSPAFR